MDQDEPKVRVHDESESKNLSKQQTEDNKSAEGSIDEIALTESDQDESEAAQLETKNDIGKKFSYSLNFACFSNMFHEFRNRRKSSKMSIFCSLSGIFPIIGHSMP